jgi:hypothetical protein
LLVLVVCATDAFVRFGYNVEIRSYSIVTCRLHTFLTYFLIHSSSFILMIISVDRVLVVTNKTLVDFCRKRPITVRHVRRRKSCGMLMVDSSGDRADRQLNVATAKRTMAYMSNFSSCCPNWRRVDVATTLILSFIFLLNSHYLFFLNLNQIDPESSSDQEQPHSEDAAAVICFPHKDDVYFHFLVNWWVYIDICVYSFVPFVVMAVCSLIILGKIVQKNANFHNHRLGSTSQSGGKQSKKNRQLLYMLLLTNLYFLLSQLPFCITFVLFQCTYDYSAVIQPIVHLISYSNNSVNFIFYGLSSQVYRQELLNLVFLRPSRRESVLAAGAGSNTTTQHRRTTVVLSNGRCKNSATTTPQTTN